MNKREAERMQRIKQIVEMLMVEKKEDEEIIINMMAKWFISHRLARDYLKTAKYILKNGKI